MRHALFGIVAFVLVIGLGEAAAGCVTGDHAACLSADGYAKAITALKQVDAATFFSLDCNFTEPGHPTEVMSDYNLHGVNGKIVSVQYGHHGKRDLFRRNVSPTGWVVVLHDRAKRDLQMRERERDIVE